MAVNERQNAVRTVVSMASRQPGKDGGAVGIRGCEPPAATTRRSLLEFDKNRRSDLPVGQGARSRSGRAHRNARASRVDSLADIRLYRGGHWRVDRYYGPSSEVISLWGNPRFKRSGSSLSLRYSGRVVFDERTGLGPERGDIFPYLQVHKDGAAAAGNSPVHGGTGPRSFFLDPLQSTTPHVRPHATKGARTAHRHGLDREDQAGCPG